jgi:hypothetical protein
VRLAQDRLALFGGRPMSSSRLSADMMMMMITSFYLALSDLTPVSVTPVTIIIFIAAIFITNLTLATLGIF